MKIKETVSQEVVLEYLQKVKVTFSNETYVYVEFIGIMKEYMAKKINSFETTSRVCNIFKDHHELITGFSQFLPSGMDIIIEGNHIYFQDGDDRKVLVDAEESEQMEIKRKVSFIVGPDEDPEEVLEEQVSEVAEDDNHLEHEDAEVKGNGASVEENIEREVDHEDVQVETEPADEEDEVAVAAVVAETNLEENSSSPDEAVTAMERNADSDDKHEESRCSTDGSSVVEVEVEEEESDGSYVKEKKFSLRDYEDSEEEWEAVDDDEEKEAGQSEIIEEDDRKVLIEQNGEEDELEADEDCNEDEVEQTKDDRAEKEIESSEKERLEEENEVTDEVDEEDEEKKLVREERKIKKAKEATFYWRDALIFPLMSVLIYILFSLNAHISSTKPVHSQTLPSVDFHSDVKSTSFECKILESYPSSTNEGDEYYDFEITFVRPWATLVGDWKGKQYRFRHTNFLVNGTGVVEDDVLDWNQPSFVRRIFTKRFDYKNMKASDFDMKLIVGMGIVTEEKIQGPKFIKRTIDANCREARFR